MELTQLEQMIRWLDEERKKDKALISALEERLELQQQRLEQQAQQLESQQQDLNVLRADLHRTDEYPAIIEKTHRDLSGMIEEIRDQVRRERVEAERLRQMELEAMSSQIGDLDKRLRVLPQHTESLKAREAGEQRLQTAVNQISNSLNDLVKRTDDRLQSIVYLEEQRRADARRLAGLEGDLQPLRKTVDELNAKLVRLEDSVRKLRGRVEEAIQIAKSYDPRLEELRVADFQREQRMKRYADQADKVNEEMAKMLEQTQRYALLYNQNKQALNSLEAFQARLDKRQNETGEMQRLTEERLKRQWEEWQANFARDWQKRLVTEEDRWRRQDLANQKATEHLAQLDEHTELYYQEVVGLWEEFRALADRWSRAVQDLSRVGMETTTTHLKELRRFAEEQHKELL